MNQKLVNSIKRWKGNDNNTTLLFSLKGLEILQEKREQVKTNDVPLQERSLTQV